MDWLAKIEGARSGTDTNIDAVTVVGDLKQLQASILDNNLKGGRTRIHCIFDQLLQRMSRGDYDFAGSNFVNNILIKSLDKPVSSGSALGLLGCATLILFGA